MDEHEILSHLDARGRAAATGLHTALTDRPVPDFDPEVVRVTLVDHPVPRSGARRWAPVAGIAAALLLVLGVTVALTQGGDDDSTPAENVEVVLPPRRYLATDLPEGLELRGAGQGGGELFSGPVVLYGTGPDALGLAVSVAGPEAIDPSWEEDPTAEPAEIGGRDGYRVSSIGGVASMVAVTVGGRWVTVMGRDEALVDAVAAAVTLAGDRPRVPSELLPAGWAAQGEVPDLTALSPYLSSATADGGSEWWATWSRDVDGVPYPDEGEEMDPDVAADLVRNLSVTSSRGDVTAVAASGFTTDAVDEVEVRGRRGLLARQSLDDLSMEGGEGSGVPGEPNVSVLSSMEVATLTWLERPGEVIRVIGLGVTRAEVLAAAESLVVADDTAWAAAERQALIVRFEEEGSVVVAEGHFSDGSPWVLTASDSSRGVDFPEGFPGPEAHVSATASQGRVAGEHSVHPDIRLPPNDPDAEQLPAGLVTVVSEDVVGELRWLSGLVTAEVRTVELLDTGGSVVSTVEPVTAENFHGWVAEVDPDVELDVLVLRGADGTEVGRIDISG